MVPALVRFDAFGKRKFFGKKRLEKCKETQQGKNHLCIVTNSLVREKFFAQRQSKKAMIKMEDLSKGI